MSSTNSKLTRVADNIRILSAAMVEKAKSGHPGGAMGGADFVTVLYTEFLRYDPDNMAYPYRDRFFLDPGHMSPMLYSVLSLAGYYTTEDLQSLRQWGSVTPGHPEVDVMRGVENTSGPLGQGHAMALGAAIAERFMAARFGEWMAHKTYAYISDGAVEEEISQGVGRIAGHLGLSNFIMYYDSNNIQLSTKVDEVDTENVAMKYEAWGWNVLSVDGHNINEIREALVAANSETERPTLIIGHTIMGKGARTTDGGSFEDKVSTHGQPLTAAGADFAATVKNLGGDPENPFAVFEESREAFAERREALRAWAARQAGVEKTWRGEHGELPPNDWQSLFGGPAWQQVDDGQWYLHMFAKEQPDLNWKNPDVHEEFKKTLRFWSDHGTDGFRIDVAHGLAKDLDSVPLADMDPAAVQHVLPADGAFSPLWDRPEVHDIYREWRQVFNEYNPPRFAVGEAWVKAESQHLYASTDELGQVFNFEFAEANWFADEFRTAIADGLRAAEETHGSTTTWVMNNHDVPRSPSRFGLPQVKDAPYHQLAHDWLLRDGETYRENRELGTRRARAAALMELGLPGSAYVYQGEELGLFEVANIPWDRLEDPTPFNTRRNFTDKGRDGCRAPMPWKAADCGEPASWSPDFITGGTFGFGPEQGDSADAHLPQPAWFKDFAADVEADDNGSMLHLYRKLLQLRQTVLTATGDTSADLLDMGDTVVAYSRPATEGRRFLSVTNFGDEPIALPDDAVAIANSVPLTDDGKLDSDASVWLLLG